MKILAICGSLRNNSLNNQLLNAVSKLIPDNITFQIQTLENIALYNEDLENNKPTPVIDMINAISKSDALLFATPEYNHSIPGVLKNAIDWASRPAFQSPLANKPCGIITASMSPIGGARAQSDLKNVLASTLSPIYPSIEFLLGSAHELFNQDSTLTNEIVIRRLNRYINGFITWVKTLNTTQLS